MNTKPSSSLVAAACAAAVLCCASCGGGSSSPADDADVSINSSGDGATLSPSSTTSSSPSSEGAPAPAPVTSLQVSAYPDLSRALLPLPSTIADGSTVELQCGRVYQGTLNLRGKSNVTVKAVGTCGKAAITPGQPITGWSWYKGNIYSVPIAYDAAQVMVDAKPIAEAHWPSRSQTWAKATSTTSTTLSYVLPNADLVGATLVFRPQEWAIDARKVTAYASGVMALAPTGKLSFDNGKTETYRVSSDVSVNSIQPFAVYDRNDYSDSSSVFANFAGRLINFAQWKQKTGHDGASAYRKQ